MRFDLVTIFPGFFAGPLDYGIVRRARASGLVQVGLHDLRDFAHDRHRTVDDRPFGGGEGMVLKPEPLFEAAESLLPAVASRAPTPPESSVAPAFRPAEAPETGSTSPVASSGPASTVPIPIILLSASGKLFRQADARRLAQAERMVLLCGRYEGVDERVAEHLATEELSVGDFVLSGGELAAALIVDAVTRLLPGALGNEDSTVYESFSPPDQLQQESDQRAAPRASAQAASAPLLLDFPHYTRPAQFRGWSVPEILIGGNHEEVRRWRRQMALEKTRRNRPDLLDLHP